MKTQSERKKISSNDEHKKIKSPYFLISVYLVIERERERERESIERMNQRKQKVNIFYYKSTFKESTT